MSLLRRIEPIVCDPVADAPDAREFYNINLVPMEDFNELDCLVIAVSHKEFKELTDQYIDAMFKNKPENKKIIVDVKGILNKRAMLDAGFRYWRL